MSTEQFILLALFALLVWLYVLHRSHERLLTSHIKIQKHFIDLLKALEKHTVFNKEKSYENGRKNYTPPEARGH